MVGMVVIIDLLLVKVVGNSDMISSCLIDFLFQFRKCLHILLLAAKQIDDFSRRAELVEGINLEDFDILYVLNTFISISFQQGFEHLGA